MQFDNAKTQKSLDPQDAQFANKILHAKTFSFNSGAVVLKNVLAGEQRFRARDEDDEEVLHLHNSDNAELASRTTYDVA